MVLSNIKCNNQNNAWNNSIDWIKAICMLMIVVTHFNWSSEQRMLALFPFHIDMAVPLLMLITGYNYCKSYERKENAIIFVKKCIKRLLQAIIPVLVIEFIILLITTEKNSIFSIIWFFVSGGEGPGAYYIPVMIQIALVFPLIYMITKKTGLLALVMSVLLCLVWEVAYLAIGHGLYKFVSIRYFVFIVAGILYALNEEYVVNRKRKWMLLIVLGVIIIWFLSYSGSTINIFDSWKSTAFPTLLYAFPIFLFIITSKLPKNNIIQLISRASFHIFLVQKLYYGYISKSFEFFSMWQSIPISILICIIGGIIFYSTENYIMKFIKSSN